MPQECWVFRHKLPSAKDVAPWREMGARATQQWWQLLQHKNPTYSGGVTHIWWLADAAERCGHAGCSTKVCVVGFRSLHGNLRRTAPDAAKRDEAATPASLTLTSLACASS